MGGPGPLRPFWQKIQYIGGDHTAFPGDYLLAYPFVQVFKDNKWGTAIPHIIATIFGFYFLYRIYTSCYCYYHMGNSNNLSNFLFL